MNWQLLVTKSAKKELARLPDRDQIRIERVLDEIRSDPFRGDIKRLGAPSWRRRSGSYRIFYDLLAERNLIVVTGIKRRTSTTY